MNRYQMAVASFLMCGGLMGFGQAWAQTQQETPPAVSSTPVYDGELTQFPYPYPVKYFETCRQQQVLRMAYMDVSPAQSPRGVVVFMHGKNFSGFYFAPLIKALVAQNYRVIVPDQVGFGKSSKPAHFQFSFHALAALTQDLLQAQSVDRFTLVGHSMGGMLATRYGLMYPEQVKKLILVNPIGLEDYKRWTGYQPLEALYAAELQKTPESIRDYQRKAYYDGNWKPAYEAMIQPALGWLKGPDYAQVAYNAAQTIDMLYTQPVVYEFDRLSMPVTLILGQRDKTAPGRAWAPPAHRDLMGNYPVLGPQVAAQIPQAKLIKIPGLGHMPFVEDFSGFMALFLPEI